MSMKCWKFFGMSLLAAAGITQGVWAQVPAVPGVPVAPAVPVAPGVAPVVPGAAPAAPGNIWSMLCLTPEQRQACREKLCNSIIGKLASGFLKPAAAFSGGLIQDPCATLITQEDLAKPADSAEGAAARIKQDELEAKARRQAVRYLGTVDCSRWPEAELALINALRADKNECVRLEAAIVLGRGCCCTPKTIKALSLSAVGSERDGFPEERSARVRAAAAASLEHCLACLAVEVPLGPPAGLDQQQDKDKFKERGPSEKETIQKLAYYQQLSNLTLKSAMDEATVALHKQPAGTQPMAVAPRAGRNGLFGLISNAVATQPIMATPVPEMKSPANMAEPTVPVMTTEPPTAMPPSSMERPRMLPDYTPTAPVGSTPYAPVSGMPLGAWQPNTMPATLPAATPVSDARFQTVEEILAGQTN